MAVLREHAGPAAVMAVVKADGYGHGASAVARAAVAAGAAELGVATIGEALALRGDGITAPVLAWLHPPGTDFAPALTADVQIGVSSVRQIERSAGAVEATGRRAEVTVKVDTGLNRNGVAPDDYPAVLDALPVPPPTTPSGCAASCRTWPARTNPRTRLNDLQGQRFTEMLAEARRRGVDFEVAHLSNSPSAMTRPDLGFDMVRPGIAVYGLNPVPDRGEHGSASRDDAALPGGDGQDGARRRGRLLRP